MIAPEGVNVGLDVDGIVSAWFRTPSASPLQTTSVFKIGTNRMIITDFNRDLEGMIVNLERHLYFVL